MDNLLIFKIRGHRYLCTKRAKIRFDLKKNYNLLILNEKKFQESEMRLWGFEGSA